MSNNKQYSEVKPLDIMDATGLNEFDTTSMLLGVMRSDFSLDLLIEWLELDMMEISYHVFIDARIENLASHMQSDLSAMMDVDMHLGFIHLIKEQEKLVKINEEAEDK
jgi:hypothetical protein